MKSLSAFLGGLCVISLGGCVGPTDVANRYFATEKYPAKSPTEVTILASAPSEPHFIIAEFQSRNESPASVQKKAAEIGADAVIITLLGGHHSLSQEWASDDKYRNKSYTRILGVALKYSPEGSR